MYQHFRLCDNVDWAAERTSQWRVVCRYESVAPQREGGVVYEWIIGNRHFPWPLHPCTLTWGARRRSKQGKTYPIINPLCTLLLLYLKPHTSDCLHSPSASHHENNCLWLCACWWLFTSQLQYVYSGNLFGFSSRGACRIQYKMSTQLLR